jgi:F0F1-type ATP synthase beta subunit
VILSRNLAQRYHYPAIDILASISRLANTVSGSETKKATGVIRRLMADYADSEDLINVGAYKPGSNPRLDEAIAKRDGIEKFLIQTIDEKSAIHETLKELGKIAGIQIPEEEMEVYIPKMVSHTDEEESLEQDDEIAYNEVSSETSSEEPYETLTEALIPPVPEEPDIPEPSEPESSEDEPPLMDFD